MPMSSYWSHGSDDMTELFAAHAAALGELRNAPHTAANHFAKKGKDGRPIANYADLATVLDTIRPVLAKHGLSVMQAFVERGDNGGNWCLVTTLGHKSGQYARSYLPMRADMEPQKFAGAATYYKRIALCAVLGIASEDDDDGEVAQQAASTTQAADSGQRESMAIKALNAAKTAADRAAIVAKAQGYVSAGTLSPQSLLTIQSHRQTLDAAEAEAAEMQAEQPSAAKGRRQPAEVVA